MLAGGGDDLDAVCRTAMLYDPERDTWSAGPRLAVHHTDHAQVLLSDGRVMTIGGETATMYVSNEAQIIDVANNKAFATARMLIPRYRPKAAALPGGKVLVGGGREGDRNPDPAFEVYDPSSDTWTASKSPPGFLHPGEDWDLKDTSMITMTSLSDGRVLITGSNFASDCGRAFLYDPSGDSWRETPRLPVSAAPSGSLRLPDGRVMVVAGGTCTDRDWFGVEETGRKISEPSDAVQIFDPKTETWSVLAPMKHRRWSSEIAWLGCGGVLVADTYSHGSLRTFAFDYYDLHTDHWSSLEFKYGGDPGYALQSLPDGSVLSTSPMVTVGGI